MKYIEERAAEIAAMIRADDTWNLDLLEELCFLADMSEEWREAGGDFEDVAFAAADKLGVEII